jgi:hypothetical protein
MVMGSDRATLGELRNHSFPEIWHGAAYEAFRTDLLSDDPPAVCAGCAVYQGRF